MSWTYAISFGVAVFFAALAGWNLRGLRVNKRREPIWKPHETDDVIRDLIRQRDRFQRQAIDMQLAANGLLAEREELFRELRRRAN